MIRRQRPSQNHRERWMVSYLDVVTILLVFFVAAAAKTHASRTTAPPPPPPGAVPAMAPPPTRDTLLDRLSEAGVDVRRDSRGVVASISQTVLFSAGDDRISRDALPAIDRIAQVLRTIPNQVILVGHADAAPIHNARFKNNWELSVARGMRVLELLSEHYQIDERRMSVSGDGSNLPADTNETKEGRALNRRVEVVILGEPADGIHLSGNAPAQPIN